MDLDPLPIRVSMGICLRAPSHSTILTRVPERAVRAGRRRNRMMALRVTINICHRARGAHRNAKLLLLLLL